jgi:hypothetical protein
MCRKVFKYLSLYSLFCLGFLLTACAGNSPVKDQGTTYDGVGQYNITPPATTVSGAIQTKNYQGGSITVEARRSVTCQYGRCPIIGAPAVDETSLSSPGPYTLNLSESAKDLMIIATYKEPSGQIRIAHTCLVSDATSITNVDLSLDRPYPPLR